MADRLVDVDVVDNFLKSGGEMDAVWLIFGAVLVFFMQTGFAMLEAGIVSQKNTINVLLKNVCDATLGGICWYLVGYGIAYGESADGAPSFIGTDKFALHGSSFTDGTGYAYALWLFQWAFAATTATIVSGAVAERCTFTAYMTYTIVLVSFIYPIVVHWGWSADGWASPWREDDLLFGCGVTDFAGSGIVHLTGAMAAFWGCFFLGPRRHRNPEQPEYGYVFQTLGTLILFFGWFGFNGCSTLYIVGYGQVAALAMVNTTLSAGAATISTLFFAAFYDKYIGKSDEKTTIRLSSATNGLLAGLVSITASCSVVDPYGAVCIGLGGSVVYTLASRNLHSIPSYGIDGTFGTGTIDDVIDAIPVHGACGAYGVFIAGFFATESNWGAAYYSDRADKCAGVFYGGTGDMLAANIVFLLALIAWASVCSILIFGCLRFVNLIRVEPTVEEHGLDHSEHGAPKPVKVDVNVARTNDASLAHYEISTSTQGE